MTRTILTASLCLTLCACSASKYKTNSHEWPAERRTAMNQWIVQDYEAEAIRSGVIASHTLYAHHFHAQSDQLNALGERDLDILAAHYRNHPGPVNVRRSAADEDLHEARIARVKSELEQRGVDIERIALSDGPAGGPGLDSSAVLLILEKKMDAPLSTDDTRTGSGIATSTN